jgi:hypothetical protein
VLNKNELGLPRGIAFDADASAYRADRSGRIGAMPLGVARPVDIAQIEALVRWANKLRVPLVPVSSRGGPRRRGDTICPVPAVIVDLSGMTRVVHADGRDAIAVIETGVTFDELDAALAPHGLAAYRPLLPRRSKSVVAAFLEREPITCPGQHWDSADPLAALELVFGSGDAFRTGGAALPGTVEENLKRGNRQMLCAGPGQTDFGRVVQGAQGSLAIVGRASIICQRKPARTMPLFVTADSLAPLVTVAYAMLRKRLDGQLFLVNAAQLALITGAARAVLPRWALYVELTAPSYFSDEAIAWQRGDLDAAAASHGAVVAELAGSVAAAGLAMTLARSPAEGFGDLRGAQEEVFFISQMSRAQTQIDALKDVADMDATPIYIQPVARRTARTAAERCNEAGAFFSRPYHLWADLSFAGNDTITPLLARTKSILDPNGILQPNSLALGAANRFLPMAA